jgi:uncharacterized membrane protein YccC
MPIVQITGFRSALLRTHWGRGLRAGLAVGGAMLVCYLLGKPMGWAALGGLQVIMADNGGPYRSRLANIVTVLLGGSIAVALGVIAGVNLPVAVVVSLLFCFVATLARVLSQPLASSSVTILVAYIVAFGSSQHTFSYGLTSTGYFVFGGLWASLLALLLWPADPFRPARNAVADVYFTLSEFIRALPAAHTAEGQPHFHEVLARLRLRIEEAQLALAATPARMTSRTIRARNLSVLNESADLLTARIMRFAELGSRSADGNHLTADAPLHLPEITIWLLTSLAPIESALRQRPVDHEAAFAPEGSLSVELHRTFARLKTAVGDTSTSDSRAHLVSALLDSLLIFEVTYEAVRAIWSGVEPRSREAARLRNSGLEAVATKVSAPMLWTETLRANLTLRSIMFRHALRLSTVVAIDVLLIHFTRIQHGYWLAMTSIIVLQPYAGETVRRSGERTIGTVAGAAVASLLAAVIYGQAGLLVAITVGSILAVAFYAVDYAWYCFFLTPTVVLMTLPHLRDWHFAAVRLEMTGLGALVSVLAMLLLWPERESLQLPSLLARGAAADATYLRAMLNFWQKTDNDSVDARIAAERSLLAPARRLCGLTVNDAEETLDHALLEHSIPLNPAKARTEILNRAALTFTTYLRRLTQTITTLAAIGYGGEEETSRLIARFAERLDAVSRALEQHESFVAVEAANDSAPTLQDSFSGQQLRRLERQVSVLERTASELAAIGAKPL